MLAVQADGHEILTVEGIAPSADKLHPLQEAWIEEQEPTGSPYEVVSDLIGIVHGGNRKRSVGAGRQFALLLKSRRGSR